jgi:transcriptional regulator with XRE-family HTH domain
MPRDAPFPFGRLLRRHRLAANQTQDELAERAGLSARGISDLERGVIRLPRPETARLLAAALALPPPTQAEFLAAARGAADIHRAAVGTVSAAPDRSPPPLVGRDAEQALIDRCLLGSGPPLLVLAGAPGIGKSRLLQAAAERGRRLGFGLVAGGCAQREGQEPYAPLVEALERRLDATEAEDRQRLLSGCPWLVRLLPELAAGPVEPLPD